MSSTGGGNQVCTFTVTQKEEVSRCPELVVKEINKLMDMEIEPEMVP